MRQERSSRFISWETKVKVSQLGKAEPVGPAAMADAYMYALVVELEDNNTPKLKNKLVKYFQSKKSNGGDCKVDYEQGSRTALLRFCNEDGKFASWCSDFMTKNKSEVSSLIDFSDTDNFLKTPQTRRMCWRKSRIRSVWIKACWRWQFTCPQIRAHSR